LSYFNFRRWQKKTNGWAPKLNLEGFMGTVYKLFFRSAVWVCFSNLDFERERHWLICSTSSLSLYTFDSLVIKYLKQLPLRRTIRKEYLKTKFNTRYLYDFSEIRKSFEASISNDNEKRNDNNDVLDIHPCLYFSKVQWTLKASPKGSMGVVWTHF